MGVLQSPDRRNCSKEWLSSELAFKDADVDTMYVLSDGEPFGGTDDPHRIRTDVKFWNRHRRIKIHTIAIAIGGSLNILEWLAKDSGGRHVRMP